MVVRFHERNEADRFQRLALELAVGAPGDHQPLSVLADGGHEPPARGQLSLQRGCGRRPRIAAATLMASYDAASS